MSCRERYNLEYFAFVSIRLSCISPIEGSMKPPTETTPIFAYAIADHLKIVSSLAARIEADAGHASRTPQAEAQ
jgi:hypothetical protein